MKKLLFLFFAFISVNVQAQLYSSPDIDVTVVSNYIVPNVKSANIISDVRLNDVVITLPAPTAAIKGREVVVTHQDTTAANLGITQIQTDFVNSHFWQGGVTKVFLSLGTTGERVSLRVQEVSGVFYWVVVTGDVVVSETPLTADDKGKIRQDSSGALNSFDGTEERKIQYENEILVPDISLEDAITKAIATGTPIRIRGNVDRSGQTVNVQNAVLRFSRGAMLTADTITANGGGVEAGIYQIWGAGTVVSGDWDVEKSYLQWTVGSNFSNSINNFRALTNSYQLGEITLTGNMRVPIGTGGTNAPYLLTTGKNFVLRGTETDSIILVQKQSSRSAIFETKTAFSGDIILNGVYISTQDYENGVFTNSSQYHTFWLGYDPIERPNVVAQIGAITIENCVINGDNELIRLIGNTTLSDIDFAQQEVKSIKVKNCRFNKINQLIWINRLPVLNHSELSGNYVRELFSAFLRYSSSALTVAQDSIRSSRQVGVSWDVFSNKIENDTVLSSIFNSYMVFALLEGGRIKAYNNECRNLLAMTNSGEASFIYPSGAELEFFGNNIVNTYCFGSDNDDTGMLRLKEARNAKVYNNTFELNTEALVRIGAADSLTQPLETIPLLFDVRLWALGYQFYRENSTLAIRNNVFIASILTDYSFLSSNKVLIENNVFQIGRWNKYDNNEPSLLRKSCVLSYWYNTSGTPYSNAVMSWKGNIISIDNLDPECENFRLGYSAVKAPSIALDTFSTVNFSHNILDIKKSNISYPYLYSNSYVIRDYYGSDSVSTSFASDFGQTGQIGYISNLSQNDEINSYHYKDALSREVSSLTTLTLGRKELNIKELKSDTISIYNLDRSSVSLPFAVDTIPVYFDVRVNYNDSIGNPKTVRYKTLFGFNQSDQNNTLNNFWSLAQEGVIDRILNNADYNVLPIQGDDVEFSFVMKARPLGGGLFIKSGLLVVNKPVSNTNIIITIDTLRFPEALINQGQKAAFLANFLGVKSKLPFQLLDTLKFPSFANLYNQADTLTYTADSLQKLKGWQTQSLSEHYEYSDSLLIYSGADEIAEIEYRVTVADTDIFENFELAVYVGGVEVPAFTDSYTFTSTDTSHTFTGKAIVPVNNTNTIFFEGRFPSGNQTGDVIISRASAVLSRKKLQ